MEGRVAKATQSSILGPQSLFQFLCCPRNGKQPAFKATNAMTHQQPLSPRGWEGDAPEVASPETGLVRLGGNAAGKRRSGIPVALPFGISSF